MQGLLGLITSDFDVKSHVAIGKIEVDTTGWNNFEELPDVKSCDINSSLLDEVVLLSASSFSIVCLNTGDKFSWQDTGATHYNWLRQGRKIRIYMGINVSGTDYYWKWITGRIDAPKFTQESGQEICTVTGRCLMRMLIENRLKQEYWGTQVFFDTHDNEDEYVMPAACTGVHRVFLDSKTPYDGTNLKEIRLNSDYTYDWTINTLLLLRSIIPYYEGIGNLVVYYHTAQVPERVVADVLVESGFLREDERVAWLANTNHVTPTGEIIDRVWFKKGTACLEALRLIAEAVQYRFYPNHDGIPVFKPPPVVSSAVKLVTIDNITVNNRKEMVNEVKNHVLIIGEYRKKLVKIPTVTTHTASIVIEVLANKVTVTLYGVVDSIGRQNLVRRGFQWGDEMLVVGGAYSVGSFGIGEFKYSRVGTLTNYFGGVDGTWFRAYVKSAQGVFFGKWTWVKVIVP